MSKSIIDNEKRCIFCGDTVVHKHHCYGGKANRRLSEKYGCWVYLCPKHHNMSNEGVHFNKYLDLMLKMYCQQEFEKEHTRDEFRAIFGKSYL